MSAKNKNIRLALDSPNFFGIVGFQWSNGFNKAEQMEDLQELLKPNPTTWFNHTHYQMTKDPIADVSCFSCYANEHTNGVFELAPNSRPNLARLRIRTRSMRGNYNLEKKSSRAYLLCL